MSEIRTVTRRVLVISHLYPTAGLPVIGSFVHEQARALRASGLDVRVLTGQPAFIQWCSRKVAVLNILHFLFKAVRRRIWWAERGDYQDVPVYRVYYPAVPFFGLDPSVRFFWACMKPALSAIHEHFPFDIVHAHTALHDGTLAAYCGERFGVPTFLTEHTGPFNCLTSTPFLRRATEKAVNGVDRVIPVSRCLANDIAQEIRLERPERVVVVPNGVDTTLFFPVPGFVPPQDRIHALWIGHYVEVKQIDMLIDAFAVAAAQEPRLRLRLLGDTMCQMTFWKRAIRRDVGHLIFFQPQTSRQHMPEAISEAHFLVISSKSETFGVAAIEALACGRPVLTTDCGGPTETVDRPELGLVVENSVDGLAKGLLEMSRRLDSFDSAAIRAHAVANFDFGKVAEKISAIYDAVYAKRER